MTGGGRIVRVALAIVLLGAAFGLYTGRKAFFPLLFVRGTGGAAAPALPAGDAKVPVITTVAHTRVALLDGVDAATARKLPAYDALCRSGLDLTVDVGFPTVSLPVQSVLWTGLTQQQSGVQFVGELIAPPLRGLPGKTPSIAVAENYQYIVHSLDFARRQPATPAFDKSEAAAAAKTGWIDAGFLTAARDAVVGGDTLAFVHILGADTAGHKSGRDSDAFRAAAERADRQLAQLLEAAPPDADTRWFVLADHGHRGAGGHGGEEDEIRLVRACIAGAGITKATPESPIHLVDLSRAIADSLGVAPDPDSAGRTLASAIAAPDSTGDTLPSPGAIAIVVAGAVMLVGFLIAFAASRAAWWSVPVWLAIAYTAVVLIQGWPTLSNPMVYKPLGKDMWMAALPGLIPFALIAIHAARRLSAAASTAVLLAPPLAAAGAALILCWGDPPLMPRWTAHASLFLVLSFSACGVVALVHLVAAVLPWVGRSSVRGTS